MLDLNVLAEEIAAIVKEQVELAVVPLVAANATIATRLTAAEARSAGLDEFTVRQMIDAAIAALPAPRDGTSVTIAEVEPLVAASVERAVAALPVAKDGTSVTIAEVEPIIAQAVDKAVNAIPPALDGKSVTVDDLEPAIASAVERAVAVLPVAKDGTSVTIADVEPIIAQAVDKAVNAIPPALDGKSVTVNDLEPAIASAVKRAVDALPVAKDGIGVAGALIDRSGALVMTLSDGKLCELGRVEGKNGEPGVGFDDMSIEQTGERTVTLKFVRGEQVKTFDLSLPVVIDRGVFKEGQTYVEGDAVTFGGSLWIAQRETAHKPDGPDTGWRLAVKKGRDGRDLTRD